MHWLYEQVTVTGDIVREKDALETEKLDLWCCDPVEFVRELLGVVQFCELLAYTPERVLRFLSGMKQHLYTAILQWWCRPVMPFSPMHGNILK